MPISRGTWWSPGQAGSPLRRPVDRRQARATVALLLAAVVLVPVLSWLAGAWTYRWNSAVERVERDARHQVGARLQDGASLHSNGRPYLVVSLAPATWRAPDGTARSGLISVPAGAVAGSTLQIWTDSRGAVADAPQTHSETVLAALVTLFLALLISGSGIGAVHLLLRRRFEQQRYALWDAEWATLNDPHRAL